MRELADRSRNRLSLLASSLAFLSFSYTGAKGKTKTLPPTKAEPLLD